MARVSAEARERMRAGSRVGLGASDSEVADLLADLADAKARAERAEAAIAEALAVTEGMHDQPRATIALALAGARMVLTATRRGDGFDCCGGNDEHPKHHCSDCDEHPWVGSPDPRCVSDPTRCVHATKTATRRGEGRGVMSVTVKPSVHYAPLVGRALCGCDEPNKCTTKVRADVTCWACLESMPRKVQRRKARKDGE